MSVKRPLSAPAGAVLVATFIEAITTNPQFDTSFVPMDGAGMPMTMKKR